jgi:hypothetical protein
VPPVPIRKTQGSGEHRCVFSPKLCQKGEMRARVHRDRTIRQLGKARLTSFQSEEEVGLLRSERFPSQAPGSVDFRRSAEPSQRACIRLRCECSDFLRLAAQGIGPVEPWAGEEWFRLHGVRRGSPMLRRRHVRKG